MRSVITAGKCVYRITMVYVRSRKTPACTASRLEMEEFAETHFSELQTEDYYLAFGWKLTDAPDANSKSFNCCIHTICGPNVIVIQRHGPA